MNLLMKTNEKMRLGKVHQGTQELNYGVRTVIYILV